MDWVVEEKKDESIVDVSDRYEIIWKQIQIEIEKADDMVRMKLQLYDENGKCKYSTVLYQRDNKRSYKFLL
ncbi:MAG: hypothetical protein ACUVQP_08805 [Bacteroidales bacterium]